MRSPTSRILTILPLVVLITLSFLVLFAKGTAASSPDLIARHARQFASKRSLAARQRGGEQGGGLQDPSSSGSSSSSSSTSVTSHSATRDSGSSSSSSSTLFSSSTPTFSPNPLTTSSITSTSESSSSSSLSTSSTPSSSISSSTSTKLSSTSSKTSSSTTSSSSSGTTLQVTSIPISTATAIVPATNIQGEITSTSSSDTAVQTSAEASNSEAASSKGFLSNSGAMAGTFTAVGVVVVGGICAIVVFLRRRKRSQEFDIFDTEYKEYTSGGNDLGGTSGGNADYFVSDMSSLSANAVSHAGARTAELDYANVDYGFGPPPIAGAASSRTSVASNHAGYGAFRSANEIRKPPMQRSGLRTETTWNPDAAYAEPAVEEKQSIDVVPNDYRSHYTTAVRAPGMSY